MPTLNEKLIIAFTKFQTGDYNAARSLYEDTLVHDPKNPEALFYLALTEIQQDHFEQALPRLLQVAQLYPDKIEILEPLGGCLLQLNRTQESEVVLEKALLIDPNSIAVLKNLAYCNSILQRPEKAIQFLEQAKILEPANLEVNTRLARAYKSVGAIGKCRALIEEFIGEQKPNKEMYFLLGLCYQVQQKWLLAKEIYLLAKQLGGEQSEILNNLGIAEHKLGNLVQAQKIFEEAISLRANFPQAHANLGMVLTDLADWLPAEKALLKAHDLEPKNSNTLNSLGTLYHRWGKLDHALKSFLKAEKINSDCAYTKMNIGLNLHHMGRLEESLKFYSEACKLDPEDIEYLRNFALAFHYTPGCEEFEVLQSHYAKPDLPPSDRAKVCFSFGKAHEDLKDYERAFEYFIEGHSYLRKEIPFNFAAEMNFFKSLIDSFHTDFLKSVTISRNSATIPIFILGMPRSGTTLTEQIISSHPKVFGAGEIQDLRTILINEKLFSQGLNRNFMNGLNLQDWTHLGKLYLESIKRYDQEHPYLVNKMPANFMFLGCIALMLPEAIIIHCQRNPLDTCISIFKHYFQAYHSYQHDLRELGLYYRMYHQLMDHWREVLPGRFLDLQYENMVTRTDEWIPRLLEYCGLDFHPDCLNFHQSERGVKTASATQVRKPIYQSSVRNWKRYKSTLQPLLDSFKEPIENLKPVIVDLD